MYTRSRKKTKTRTNLKNLYYCKFLEKQRIFNKTKETKVEYIITNPNKRSLKANHYLLNLLLLQLRLNFCSE